MSRKLMMNNIESSVLSPVTSDLLCWLDDRDGYESSRVHDRMGLNDFLLEGDFSSNPYVLNNAHKFYSENSFALSGLFTISMTVTIGSIGTYGLLFAEERAKATQPSKFKISNRNNTKIGLYSATTGGVNEGVPIIFNTPIDITMTFNNKLVSIYDSKVITQTTVNNQSLINYRVQLGSYGNGAGDISNFKLHSLKVYNRVLSDAEILQNYNYEQSITRG